MTNHEPFAQSVAERIEIHPAIKRTERRRSGIWTLTLPADGVTFRAQSLRQGLAMPLQRTRLVLRGETRRCSEQQKQGGKLFHLDFPASVAALATVVVIVTPAPLNDRRRRMAAGHEVRLDRATVFYRSSSATSVTT
jgi:hypothetical protein